MTTVLVLAGTTEATELAQVLTEEHGVDVLSSLAGVTARPRSRPGRVRTGGFGGIEGLVAHLRREPVDGVVDATHPFAATMPHHVAAACAATGTPSCRLLRPGWEAGPDDRWHRVADLASAAAAVEAMGARRPLLTVGRQSSGAFAATSAHVVVRAIEAPDVLPADHELVLDRGPFTLDGELALLRDHAVDVVVTKDSGGEATAPKLEAARRLGIPVVVVDRPPQPAVPTVPDVAHAVAWVLALGSPGDGYQRGV